MRTSLCLVVTACLSLGPAGAAEAKPRSCPDVTVSFTFGGTTKASRVRVLNISCKAAKKKVIVPCLYQDRPSGWRVTREGDRVTLRSKDPSRRVSYTTNARGGCKG